MFTDDFRHSGEGYDGKDIMAFFLTQ
jgi:hypothetical protein